MKWFRIDQSVWWWHSIECSLFRLQWLLFVHAPPDLPGLRQRQAEVNGALWPSWKSPHSCCYGDQSSNPRWYCGFCAFSFSYSSNLQSAANEFVHHFVSESALRSPDMAGELERDNARMISIMKRFSDLWTVSLQGYCMSFRFRWVNFSLSLSMNLARSLWISLSLY